jgi:hypothetical protein
MWCVVERGVNNKYTPS